MHILHAATAYKVCFEATLRPIWLPRLRFRELQQPLSHYAHFLLFGQVVFNWHVILLQILHTLMVPQKHLPVVLGPVIPVLEIRVQCRFGVQIRRTPRYLATLLLCDRVF